MKTTKISIILVNWNSYQDTLKCLKSISALEHPQVDLDIIVVDNASDDNSVVQIKKHAPQVTIIQLDENKGFTGGNNIGVSQALKNKSEYVWFLNNDTEVDSKSLMSLLRTFHDPSVGIAGSKIYFMKNHEYHKSRYKTHELGNVLWYAGGIIDWNNIYGSHRGVDEVDNGQYDNEEETPFVTGCSMMITRQCLELTSGFDNKYFAYLEDMDICQKIEHAGYKVMYVPNSKVWHKNAGSTGGAGNKVHQYYMTRNRLLFGFRYGSTRTIIALCKEALRLLRTGTDIQKQAIIDALFGRWGKRKD